MQIVVITLIEQAHAAAINIWKAKLRLESESEASMSEIPASASTTE